MAFDSTDISANYDTESSKWGGLETVLRQLYENTLANKAASDSLGSVSLSGSQNVIVRTTSGSTASTTAVEVFTGTTAAQSVTVPVAPAPVSGVARCITYSNHSSQSWTLAIGASDSLDGGTAGVDLTLTAGSMVTICATEANKWFTISKFVA